MNSGWYKPQPVSGSVVVAAPVMTWHPADLFKAQSASVTVSGIGHEVGYIFYVTKSGLSCTGGRFWWPTAGATVNTRMWQISGSSGQLALKANASVLNDINAFSWTTPIALTPYVEYAISMSDGTKYSWSKTGPAFQAMWNGLRSVDSGAIGATKQYGLAGDVVYEWCAYASGGAGTIVDTDLIAATAGVVGIEPVIAFS